MPDDFLDRTEELAALERAWRAAGASLIVVWGRRRTGKTRLLGRFVEGKPAVYHGATEQASALELARLSDAARAALRPGPGDLLAHGDFPDWPTALSYLGQRARRQRLLVVLDEFPYLVRAEPALPSIVQRFWDHEGRRTKLRLVLCGSATSVMEDLQREHAPLFGRVDLRLHVRPFSYLDAAAFHPRLAPAERAIAYGVLGGMPGYQLRWDDRVSHRANLRRLFGDPTSPLLDEGEFVLASELPEGAGYFRILRAIAAGERTYGGIKRLAAIDIERPLDRLTALGLVERVTPVTEDPTRTKRAVYRIADNFLAFWFRFVYPHRADIARGLGDHVVDRVILPGLSDHMGEPWEEMARAFLRRAAARGELPVEVTALGRWWSGDGTVEIDVVGLRGRTAVLVGSVKWARRVGSQELARLRRAAEALPRRADDLLHVLVAREVVEDVPPGEALALTAHDLYAGAPATVPRALPRRA
ncbi:MAG TPA: ATP-binding protein [Actinomycetota bacterium]|nr:ATP-binding protein [Actinomycetota bacterium]